MLEALEVIEELAELEWLASLLLLLLRVEFELLLTGRVAAGRTLRGANAETEESAEVLLVLVLLLCMLDMF